MACCCKDGLLLQNGNGKNGNENSLKASPAQLESRWPHCLAVVLVCATFPLIWVGGLVTTTQAGMAVEDWPSTYGHNLLLYPWTTWLAAPWDLFIEHGHRLLASLVGMLSIALLISLLVCKAPARLKWLGAATLLAVIGQGVLGGMRVLLDARTLAMLHGCSGPLFFALTVTMAVVTSKWWSPAHQAALQERPATQPADRKALARISTLSVITTVLAFVQLVLGAQLRHVAVDASHAVFRSLVVFHVVTALVLFFHGVLLSAAILRGRPRNRGLILPALLLLLALSLQIGLGVATWFVKYGTPPLLQDYRWAAGYLVTAGSFTQATTVTAHVACGSLILVTALVVTLRSVRLQSSLCGAGAPEQVREASDASPGADKSFSNGKRLAAAPRTLAWGGAR